MKARFARLRSVCTLLLLGLGLVCAPRTLAHGGPPAALGLVAAHDGEPEVVLLNEGLALIRPEAWSYLCPRLWGEPGGASGKVPLAGSADGVETWVPGSDDLYLLRAGKLVAQGRPELRRNELIALASDREHVYGLHLMGTATEVVRVSKAAEPALWTSPDYWSAMTVDAEGLHLARVAGDKALELVSLDRTGKELRRATTQLELTPREMQLSSAGGRVYVTATDGALATLGYFEGTTWRSVVQGKEAILGPQASADGTLWVAVAERLGKLHGDRLERVEDSTRITCLSQWGDWIYACSGPDLLRLTDAGLGERFFGMEDFHAPDPKLVPPDAEADCSYQWLLYTNDARLLGLTFVEWPDTQVKVGGAVSASAGAGAQAAAGSSGAIGGSAASREGASAMSGGAASPEPQDGGCSVGAPRARAASPGLILLGLACFVLVRRRLR